MKVDKINILVTFDKNYINPFKTMMMSLAENNPEEQIHIWLLYSHIPSFYLEHIKEYLTQLQMEITIIKVNRNLFKDVPVMKQYPQEMYYRLMAPLILPETLDRVLYLDSDILVINSIRPLWEINLKECAFAAATHLGVTNMVKEINKIRMGIEHDYYNSGVMLMDLKKARVIIKKKEIFDYVRKHKNELVLPDQDVFNYLYGKYTILIDDAIWNYDARYFTRYLLKSSGEYVMEWLINNTVFLHFCGKRKPWQKDDSSKFAALYKQRLRIYNLFSPALFYR